MELYDSCLHQVESILAGRQGKVLPVSDAEWPDAGRNQMFFREDTAFELGGSGRKSVSGIFYTDTGENDLIELYGEDLNEIQEDQDFARITVVSIDEEKAGEGQRLYQNLRRIDYVRYHLNPKGYMMLISPRTQRENVRVSRQALQQGLSFRNVGNMFLRAYHQIPCVKAVHLIFITEKDFPYDHLRSATSLSDSVTKTLDHLTSHVKMDCQACGLKNICDEVQDLYEKDFGHRPS